MKIALFQLNSKLEYKENLEVIHNLASEAKDKGADAFFLPECFYSMSNGLKATPYLVQDDNEHFQLIREIAVRHKAYLIGGSAATSFKGNVVNRVLNFNPEGDLLGVYDKMHLFSCELKKTTSKEGAKSIDESDIYTPGTTPTMINVLGEKVGLGVCFDLRYPEMARKYVLEGASILTFASAFTVPTGKAHWHILNRSRAIENQCYVIASAQWGKHNERISTFGHSLVVDPWGDVLVDMKEGVGVEVVELDFDRVSEIRKKVKVF